MEEITLPKVYERFSWQLRSRYGPAAGDYADQRMNEMRRRGFSLKELQSVVAGAQRRAA